MPSSYAEGKRAWGRCMRCGDRYLLNQLRPDGYKPALLVCASCADIFPPAERPLDASDASALRRPSPDTDDDSPGDSGTTLAEALAEPGVHPFGGGT